MFKFSKKFALITVVISAIIISAVFCTPYNAIIINSAHSSGQIYFEENVSHSTMNLVQAFTDPKNNITILDTTTGTIETGSGNTFTVTYKNINDVKFDKLGTKITLTIVDAKGTSHTTTHETDRTEEGHLSVILKSPPGKGHYSCKAEIIETRTVSDYIFSPKRHN
ncbi:MAG: hypothetical protein RBT65_13960 [Methanolobus sp.]|jgi:hypothetical protein|nr:hypothetical protein [Methanolobus sp.]